MQRYSLFLVVSVLYMIRWVDLVELMDSKVIWISIHAATLYRESNDTHSLSAQIVCDSTVKHIFAESVQKRLQSVLSALMKPLAHTKHVWALDADITDLSICLLRNYCKRGDTTFILNTVKPAKERTVILFPTKYELLDDLIQNVKKDKRMFICADTKDIAVCIKRVLDFSSGGVTIDKESLFSQLYCYQLRNYNISRNKKD